MTPLEGYIFKAIRSWCGMKREKDQATNKQKPLVMWLTAREKTPHVHWSCLGKFLLCETWNKPCLTPKQLKTLLLRSLGRCPHIKLQSYGLPRGERSQSNPHYMNRELGWKKKKTHGNTTIRSRTKLLKKYFGQMDYKTLDHAHKAKLLPFETFCGSLSTDRNCHGGSLQGGCMWLHDFCSPTFMDFICLLYLFTSFFFWIFDCF